MLLPGKRKSAFMPRFRTQDDNKSSNKNGTLGKRISRLLVSGHRASQDDALAAVSDDSKFMTLFHGYRSRSSSVNMAMAEKVEIDDIPTTPPPSYALPTPRPSLKEVLWHSCPGLDQFSRSRTSSAEKYQLTDDQCESTTTADDEDHIMTPTTGSVYWEMDHKQMTLAEHVQKALANAFHEADREMDI